MSSLLLIVLLGFFPGLSIGDQFEWPQFRGPSSDGHATGHGLPLRWSETANLRWKTPIPHKGWSSPVIAGEQIWLTTATEDGRQLFAICVDRKTGRITHNIKVFEVEKPWYCHLYNSYASPTAVLEQGRVYVHFGSPGTACLDTLTGRILWSRCDLPCNHYRGSGSSPIVHGDLLIIEFDGVDLQYVAALDKRTGKTVWLKPRSLNYGITHGDMKKAYGTPALVPVRNRLQLVCPAALGTIAYDPDSGEELWKVLHGGMNASARPVHDKERVFVSTGDGGVPLLAIKPSAARGDVTATHVSWRYGKAVPSRVSLLLVGELLYFVNEKGIVSCLEAETGRQVWQDRLKGNFCASPLYADGRIYIFNEEGGGYVLEPGRRFRLLATNTLATGCMASPAAVGRELYVRSKSHLYRIEALNSP